METLFRKRFYLVHLALLALAAVLLARAVTTVGGAYALEALGATGDAKSTTTRGAGKQASMRDFAAAAEQNIFQARREIVVEDANATLEPQKAPDQITDWTSAPRSSLRLRLVGTVVFADPASSLASIIDDSKGGARAELYAINECMQADTSGLSDADRKLIGKPAPCNKIGDSALLKRVEPERAYIWNNADSRIEYIGLNEPPEKGGMPPPPKVSEAPVTAPAGDGKDLGAGIVKSGENSYKVPRSSVDEALNSLSDLATQARIVPAFEGGKPVGFKLFSIRPGSLYSKIGLQNGDVINRINGYEMSSPEKGLEIYQKLKDSATVTVDLKRRGKPMTLDYAIE